MTSFFGSNALLKGMSVHNFNSCFYFWGIFFPDLLRPVLRGNQSLQEPAHILRRNSGDVQRQKETWDAPSYLCHHRHSLQEYDARWVLTEVMAFFCWNNKSRLQSKHCRRTTDHCCQKALLLPCSQAPDTYLVLALMLRWLAFSCSSGLKNLASEYQKGLILFSKS